MNLYQVRLFIENKWQVIKTFRTKSEAELFAEILQPVWDIKEINITEANQVGAE